MAGKTPPAPDTSLPPETLPGFSKEFRVDHEKLKDVAKALQADLDQLTGDAKGDAGPSGYNKGTIKDLQYGSTNPRGLVTQDDLGHYPATDGLSQTTHNAYDVVGTTWNTFVGIYQEVIDAINHAANTYQKSDDATKQAADAVGSDGPAPYAG